MTANTAPNDGSLKQAVYEVLTSEDDGRVCRDIPESACVDQPRNFMVHVFSLAATKTGDGLADPKLVLAWMLTSLGAPAFLVGLLVPVREAGALLPQLFTAPAIRAMQRRKWAWAAGSLVQGLCVAGMAVAGLTLDGAAVGWSVVALLAVFSVARSVCSVSYKDVLGKTVSKATRGTATGTAGTVSSVLVLAYGALIATGILDRDITVIAGGLLVAAFLWIFAAGYFATLEEEAGATEGGGSAARVALDQFSLIWRDPQLGRFIAVRSLLTATALAPPFIVGASGAARSSGPGDLGAFVIAGALASVASSYLWGRLSDRSSRRVLGFSGLVGAAVLATAGGVLAIRPETMSAPYVAPAFLFVLMTAYQGVRLGRSTHIVDMADSATRAVYTALSNSIVGLVLVAGGAFGAIAELAGAAVVLGLFALMSIEAAGLAHGLREVQEGNE